MEALLANTDYSAPQVTSGLDAFARAVAEEENAAGEFFLRIADLNSMSPRHHTLTAIRLDAQAIAETTEELFDLPAERQEQTGGAESSLADSAAATAIGDLIPTPLDTEGGATVPPADEKTRNAADKAAGDWGDDAETDPADKDAGAETDLRITGEWKPFDFAVFLGF